MVDDQEERREIEAYLGQHHLQAFIGDAVNDIVKERPPDPLVKLGDALLACSDVTKQIQKVRGRQRLNGEGLPAVEIAIRTAQVLLRDRCAFRYHRQILSFEWYTQLGCCSPPLRVLVLWWAPPRTRPERPFLSLVWMLILRPLRPLSYRDVCSVQ